MKKMMNKVKLNTIICVAFLAILFVSCTVSADTSSGQTRTITDMAGREVTIPTTIDSVLGTAPPVTVMTYMISPDVLLGFNMDYSNSNYLPDEYKNLPNAGGSQGNKKLNVESFLSMNPDIVLYGYLPGWSSVDAINEMQVQLNPIPVVAISDVTDLSNFAPGMTFLGDILNNPEKAEEFNTFYQDIYSKVNQTTAKIPESERKRVYYAEGPEGLMTDSAVTMHAQPLNVCNGINVADIPLTSMVGRTQVSPEQIMTWNPDVIIATDKQFYDSVYSDPNWADVKAVKDKQIYLIPKEPFNWYDRSPGVNIVMGIPWTAKVLYPEMFEDMDLVSVTKEFFSKFYHYDMTDSEAEELLRNSGLTKF